MAHVQPRKNKDGKIISYSIRVYKGSDINGNQLKPYTMTFKPNSAWSERKTQTELKKSLYYLKNSVKKVQSQTINKHLKDMPIMLST